MGFAAVPIELETWREPKMDRTTMLWSLTPPVKLLKNDLLGAQAMESEEAFNAIDRLFQVG